jgi:hypothetical protein
MSDMFFRIFHTNDAILIFNIVKANLIVINKQNLSMSIEDKSYLDNINIIKSHNSCGIVGIIQIGIYEILIFISSSKKIGNIGDKEIYEIIDVDFIQISKTSENEFFKSRGEIVTILEEIKIIFREGFFYSHNFDLTNSLQNQKNIKMMNNNKYDFIQNANLDFLWNYELYAKFFDYQVDSNFLLNIIHGFVQIIREVLNDNSHFDYILISRRSTKNAGVKNIKKGVDNYGYAANYLETEQIFICGKNVFSFVQIRGNPPLLFNKFYASHYGNKKLNSETYLMQEIFDKHFKNILAHTSYKYVFVINLMNNFKQEEKVLTEQYEKLIMDRNYKNLRYTYFDYENQTKNLNTNLLVFDDARENIFNVEHDDVRLKPNDPVDKFFKQIEEILSEFKFFGVLYSSDENQDKK